MLKILPPSQVRVLNKSPSVCIGINKLPIRSVGEVSIAFKIGSPAKAFCTRFFVIENLIHPIVLGLPFLRENRAILSFEKDSIFFGETVTHLRQIGPPPKPPPLHVAAFESVTLQPWSRNWIRVYLTGTGRLEHEMNETQNLYIRPFSPETNVDVPQIAAHSIIDTSQPTCLVEVMNVWPHPINIHRDSPVGLVDTINPEIVYLSKQQQQTTTNEQDEHHTQVKVVAQDDPPPDPTPGKPSVAQPAPEVNSQNPLGATASVGTNPLGKSYTVQHIRPFTHAPIRVETQRTCRRS